MKRLKSGKTFHSKLIGVPELKMISLPAPDTVALVPVTSPFIKLKLLAGENDIVKIGTPLLRDKRDPQVHFVSPGGGKIEAIVRGPRRTIKEIIIRLDRETETCEAFAPIPVEMLEAMPREELIQILKLRGIWPFIRQFPFMDLPDSHAPLPMVVISLHPGEPFAPAPSVFLEDQVSPFHYGLAVLKQLAKKVIVAAPQKFILSLKNMGLSDQITHVTQDQYPAGDPGVILYQIKKSAADNTGCTMDAQELIAMGTLLSTGHYQTHRIYSVAGTPARPPAHYHTRMGSPVKHLVGETRAHMGIITGGLFSGALTPGDAHMGTGISSAIVLEATDKDAFFGFMWPGRKRLSESRTFLSCLNPTPLGMDATLHGEERACINCGWCDKKCPVDLLPQFIMKTVGAGEMEEALEMGLLDCTGCGLCTFVCPSKIDLAGILFLATQTCYRERVTS